MGLGMVTCSPSLSQDHELARWGMGPALLPSPRAESVAVGAPAEGRPPGPWVSGRKRGTRVGGTWPHATQAAELGCQPCAMGLATPGGLGRHVVSFPGQGLSSRTEEEELGGRWGAAGDGGR